ncbi:class I SAM-dependent methyltransferase [Micromonospora sonneratiae]|uniref:Class I SAM-dependent methyltransferase n=1 Tax=Micromonospora sonneratiae TaxID=1184706 RepID=A0ABW3YD51_9ACTN
MLRDEIMEFYRQGGEHSRLAEGQGRWEYLRTWDVLSRVLPTAPAKVLDVGGATGVYAEPLAAAGYTVHVVDPVPEQVAAAGRHPGVTAAVGDARALPAADGSTDAVLLLGPLYHLVSRVERVQAWREAARVVRPGGPVVAATISRFASLFDGFTKGYFDDPQYGPIVDRALTDGVHANDESADRTWFTTAYFHRPEEIADEVAEAGLDLERIVAVEGPVWLADSRLAELLADTGRTELLLRRLRDIEAEPSLLGASSHLLAVARRRQPPGAGST